MVVGAGRGPLVRASLQVFACFLFCFSLSYDAFSVHYLGVGSLAFNFITRVLYCYQLICPVTLEKVW